MDSYIRASGLVLYPYVFVAGPNKHDILSGILVRAETSSEVAVLIAISKAGPYCEPRPNSEFGWHFGWHTQKTPGPQRSLHSMAIVDHIEPFEGIPINWDDFDPFGDSDTDEGSPDPPPTVHADEFPGDLEAAAIPAEWKTEGDDWFVLYNPRVPRVLDISLIHDFNHENLVWCVRFSKDGMFLATGWDRAIQIFDLRTGSLACILNDETVSQEEDFIVTAVCFSHDGKYVATAAEDMLIRVRLFLLYSTPSLVGLTRDTFT